MVYATQSHTNPIYYRLIIINILQPMEMSTLAPVFQIFSKKNWNTHAFHDNVLVNICYLLQNLSDEHQKLILELLDRYIWISGNDYLIILKNVLESVENEKIEKANNIYVFPILKEMDEKEEKNKSSNAILYMIRSVLPLIKKYNHITIKELTKFEQINNSSFNPEKNDLIFLVDDFIGTGDTLDETLGNVYKNYNILLQNVSVICLACQTDSIKKIKDKDISLYYSISIPKGISDFYNGESRQEKINSMLEIESMLEDLGMFSLGWKQSEALITLMRTPDNTFPVFWKDHKKEGRIYQSPFPRYQTK